MNKEDEKVLQPKIASRDVTMHILKAFGLRMSKKLGQNFLIDARIVQGIVDAAEVKPGDRVLEIGPGIGILLHSKTLNEGCECYSSQGTCEL